VYANTLFATTGRCKTHCQKAARVLICPSHILTHYSACNDTLTYIKTRMAFVSFTQGKSALRKSAKSIPANFVTPVQTCFCDHRLCSRLEIRYSVTGLLACITFRPLGLLAL
jgi:hypothetical protein